MHFFCVAFTHKSKTITDSHQNVKILIFFFNFIVCVALHYDDLYNAHLCPVLASDRCYHVAMHEQTERNRKYFIAFRVRVKKENCSLFTDKQLVDVYKHFHKKRSHMHGKREEYEIPLHIVRRTTVTARAQPTGNKRCVIILSRRSRVLN